MLSKEEKKLKKSIENLLQWAHKVYKFRCDVLSKEQQAAFQEAQTKLSSLYKRWQTSHSKPEGITSALDALKLQLKNHGGTLSTRNFWCENAEVFLVAALIALSIRTFFIQPFRIPTCSMFPSFSGMLTQLYEDTKPQPNFLVKPFRWLLNGAENYHFKAPCDGQIQIPLFYQHEMSKFNSHIRYEVEYGREIGNFWIKHILPKPYKVYILWINQQQIRIRIPYEFTDMEALVRKKFFPEANSFDQILQPGLGDIHHDPQKGYYLNTHQYAKKGQPFLHFDILAGDMDFVDRLTYHFRQPKIGEAIVFRTRNIPQLDNDLYYIKRLAGIPGDTLSIQQNKLFRNGKLIQGSSAFRNNNTSKGLYPGYRAQGCLSSDKVFKVHKCAFFALGDNSPFSYDSRFWGEVPEKNVIGKAAFVLHPLSWRWGCAEHNKANLNAKKDAYIFK